MPWGFGRGWFGGWGFGRGWGFGWLFPFCRRFPWLPKGWRWFSFWGAYPYTGYTYPYGTSPQTAQYYGTAWGFPWAPYSPYGVTPPASEVDMLKEQARVIEEELKRIEERIKEIEKKGETK